MMGWEAPLMEQHARVICGGGGGHYLNVGFGLGIIDTYIQVHPPPARLTHSRYKLSNLLLQPQGIHHPCFSEALPLP